MRENNFPSWRRRLTTDVLIPLRHTHGEKPVQLSNLRTQATIENWPSGSRRVTAVFEVVQRPKMGERVSRTTTGKPKFTTYYKRIRIADGDDGKTYLLAHSEYNQIYVLSSDMKYSVVCYHDSDPEHAELLNLLYS